MSILHPTTRPISPHLSVYQPQITSVLSIFHRITGVVLAGILLFIPIFLTILVTDGLIIQPNILSSISILFPLLNGIYILLLLMLTYHFINGLRHLSWDLGLGLENAGILTSGSFILIFVSVTFLGIVIFPL